MYHRPQPAKKSFTLTISLIILVIILSGILIFLATKIRTLQEQQTATRIASSTQAISTSKSLETSQKTHAKVKKSITPPVKPTVEVTDYDQYNYLNGRYGNNAAPYQIDFHHHLVTTQGFEEKIHLKIYQVLRHPDQSLVINVSGAVLSQEANRMRQIHQSLLLAPAGVTVKQNWQTKTPIADQTDHTVNRLTVAESKDGGKSYEMTPAYQAFINNDPELVLIRSNE